MPVVKRGNPKGNPQNLFQNSERTPEERKKVASKAGKASGVARKKYKTYREVLESLLGATADPDMIMTAAKKVVKGNMTISEALVMVALTKALNGDFAFWKEIKETMEGKQAQKLEIEGLITLEDLIKKVEDKSEY